MNMDLGVWSARVAAVIRDEMAAQRRTPEALADVLSVSVSVVAACLDGQASFDLVEIERLCRWLGVTPSEQMMVAVERQLRLAGYGDAVVDRALDLRRRFEHWIHAVAPDRDEVAVVSHWGFIRGLTGVELRNTDSIRLAHVTISSI